MPLCITPPAPPAGTPAPTPAPVPIPPPPVYVPPPAAPAPPPPPPAIPAQLVLDWTSGTGAGVYPVDVPCGYAMTWEDVFLNSARIAGTSALLKFKVQNLTATPGTLNFQIRATDGRLTVSDPNLSVFVQGGGWALVNCTLQIGLEGGPLTLGGYTVIVEDSNGNKRTFIADFGNGTIMPDCYQFLGAGA